MQHAQRRAQRRMRFRRSPLARHSPRREGDARGARAIALLALPRGGGGARWFLPLPSTAAQAACVRVVVLDVAVALVFATLELEATLRLGRRARGRRILTCE